MRKKMKKKRDETADSIRAAIHQGGIDKRPMLGSRKHSA